MRLFYVAVLAASIFSVGCEDIEFSQAKCEVSEDGKTVVCRADLPTEPPIDSGACIDVAHGSDSTLYFNYRAKGELSHVFSIDQDGNAIRKGSYFKGEGEVFNRCSTGLACPAIERVFRYNFLRSTENHKLSFSMDSLQQGDKRAFGQMAIRLKSAIAVSDLESRPSVRKVCVKKIAFLGNSLALDTLAQPQTTAGNGEGAEEGEVAESRDSNDGESGTGIPFYEHRGQLGGKIIVSTNIGDLVLGDAHVEPPVNCDNPLLADSSGEYTLSYVAKGELYRKKSLPVEKQTYNANTSIGGSTGKKASEQFNEDAAYFKGEGRWVSDRTNATEIAMAHRFSRINSQHQTVLQLSHFNSGPVQGQGYLKFHRKQDSAILAKELCVKKIEFNNTLKRTKLATGIVTDGTLSGTVRILLQGGDAIELTDSYVTRSMQ